MARKLSFTKCACCLLPATERRKLAVGERQRPGKFSYRLFGSCAAHLEVSDRTFRILAGVKFRRTPETAPTE
ncbi:MAG TPA: hypothetical protein VMZ71_02280 [Gemmataceae bacterium]|nr:hypothetical protein [Gemmataceae bacterium]